MQSNKVNKIGPCRFFNTPNGCRYGNNCRYSHDSTAQPLCNYFNSATGCRYGNRCRYKHERKTQSNNYVSTSITFSPEYDFCGSDYGFYGTNYGFYGSDNTQSDDDESLRQISFIRPDGDIEAKTISWCTDSGFFEVSPGYWSGDWYYKFDKAIQLKLTQNIASGSVSHSANSEKLYNLYFLQNKKCYKDTYIQLRFDCVAMSESKSKWIFRRFTKEEQCKYEQQMQESEETESEETESEQEQKTDSDNSEHYNSDRDPFNDGSDDDDDDEDDFDDSSNSENYFLSNYSIYPKDDRHPEIVLSAMDGDLDAIQKYIANGVDLDKRRRWTEVQEKYGYDKSWEWFHNSALIVAAKKGYLEIVQELLLNQADPMLVSCWTDDEYHTALEAATNAMHIHDTNKMKKIIAMITVVNDLWMQLNPNCHESASYQETVKPKEKPDRKLIQKAIDDLSL